LPAVALVASVRGIIPLTTMKKYVVEFIGTFFLVFAIGMAVRSGAALAPLGIAAALTAVIYAGGHVSGAHFNPAVTLAALIRGKFDVKDAVPYVVAQLGAAVLAALIVVSIHGKPLGAASHAIGPSLVVEFLFTFALAWVILNVATAKGTAGNSFYGLAIGFTVLAGAITVGGVSGGAFNPAVGLAAVIMGLEKISQLGVYLVADLAGGAVAALTFNYVNGKD
jgi:aquaporin Z